MSLGLTVHQPTSKVELADTISGMAPIDVGVVVAYGRILSSEMIAIPRVGLVNLHFSLLPRWRGPAPIERAIEAGDLETGVSLMRIDEGLDTGDLISQHPIPLRGTDTGGAATERLAAIGARCLEAELPAYVAGASTPIPQQKEGVSYAKRLDPKEGQLHSAMPADLMDRIVRAFTPRPGAYLELNGGPRLGVHSADVVADVVEAGSLLWRGDRVVLGARAGALHLRMVQAPGKRPMAASDWARGFRGWPATLVPPGSQDGD